MRVTIRVQAAPFDTGAEAAAVIAGLGDEEYSVSTVHLTQDQFDRLPESAGF